MFKPSDLSQFYGSQGLHFNRFFRGIDYTDGVQFIGANGASWLVTDILAVLKSKPLMAKGGGFLSIKCTVKDGAATLTIGNGNKAVYHTQTYSVTDLPCSIEMYCEQGHPNPVLMLTSER